MTYKEAQCHLVNSLNMASLIFMMSKLQQIIHVTNNLQRN